MKRITEFLTLAAVALLCMVSCNDAYAATIYDADPSRAVFFLGLAIFIYMLPTFIAGVRHQKHTGAICALNILLGWTLLGWVGALVWSLLDNTREVTYGN